MNRITMHLKQITPLLHFQGVKATPCLRATEVKPEIDRFAAAFLTRQCGVVIPEEWKLQVPNETLHIALKYKLRLQSTTAPVKVAAHALYFAGSLQGATPSEALRYPNGIDLTLIPMTEARLQGKVNIFGGTLENPSLAEVLQALLPAFFALHCFGTRSGKGFGSFEIDDGDVTDEEVAFYAPLVCAKMYRLETGSANYSDVQCLDDVFILSGMMKGGFNFHNRYHPENSVYYKSDIQTWLSSGGIGSEKAYIKQCIFPYNCRRDGQNLLEWYQNTCQHHGADDEYDDYRYLRGILGLADHYEYRDSIHRTQGVKIKAAVPPSCDKEPKIERFANPVRFKPCPGGFRILLTEIPEILWGRAVIFSLGKSERAASKNPITLPKKEEFDLVRFVDTFLDPIRTGKLSKYSNEPHNVLDKQFQGRRFSNTLRNLKIAFEQPLSERRLRV